MPCLQAEETNRNPLYLMLASTVAVQCSFMLPVATPPNAVAYSTGRLKVSDMVSTICLLAHLAQGDDSPRKLTRGPVAEINNYP